MSKIKMPVEKSHIMMFTRSIGDPNPKYYEENGDEVIAPPTFIQASAQFDPDYFLRPKIGGDNWFGSGKESSGMKSSESGSGGGGAAMGLHAEQHFEYHQPLKVGDVISAEVKPGKSWEKESKRAGKLKFSESVTEYKNQNGELIITATSVGVVTEKPVES